MADSLKLVIFCPYYPPHQGGLESHAEQFSKHMAEAGFDITVFTPQLPRTAPLHETPHSYGQIIRFPAFEIIPNYPLPEIWHPTFWKQVMHLHQSVLESQLPAVVISRTRFFVTSLLALWFSRCYKLPWLHIEHGSDFVRLRNPLTRIMARWYDHVLGRRVLKTATHIVANSRATAAFIKRLAPHQNPTVIYRGVEIEAIAAITASPPYTESHSNTIFIAYAGRLIDGKGVDDLLTAAHLLMQRQLNNQWRLLLIGDGPQRARLEAQARRLHITNHTVFLGQKPWSETIATLKSCDIFVNPSYTEGLPTTVIEAALTNCAIIATDVGGTAEIIVDGKSGILFAPGDIPALTDHLATLIDNPKLRTVFAHAAFHRPQMLFSWPAATKQYQQLLRAVTIKPYVRHRRKNQV